jgi:hypothetical protein
MISVEERSAKITSKVEDLREVSLEDLAVERDSVDDAVIRVLPDESTPRLPVAAFNSMI